VVFGSVPIGPNNHLILNQDLVQLSFDKVLDFSQK
jgi:hypothetical protein